MNQQKNLLKIQIALLIKISKMRINNYLIHKENKKKITKDMAKNHLKKNIEKRENIKMIKKGITKNTEIIFRKEIRVTRPIKFLNRKKVKYIRTIMKKKSINDSLKRTIKIQMNIINLMNLNSKELLEVQVIEL